MMSPGARPQTGEDTPASPVLTRWIAALILLFLADAAQLLLLLPSRTSELFAWNAGLEINALVLGSAYVGGGYFFIRVCAGGPWYRVAGGFPPIMVFVWLAGIATFLHLDRLNGSGLPLLAWLALYVLAPLLVPILFVLNESSAGRGPARPRLPDGMRAGLGIAGGAVVALALVVFAAPARAIDAWAWEITPLTVRVVATVIALYGSVWVTVAVRGDAAGARIPLEAQAIGLGVLLVGLLRERDAIAWDSAAGLLLAGGAAAMLVTSVAIRLRLRSLEAAAARRPAGRVAVIDRRVGGLTARLAGPVGFALLVAVAGTAAAIVAATGLGGPPPSSGPGGGDPYIARLAPVRANRVAARGTVDVRLDEDVATVTLRADGLVRGAHLMHVHARATCPPASAARPHGGHLAISTLDGAPYYGDPVVALTTRGDTSPRSLLAFTRSPASGTIRYRRAIRLSAEAARAVRAGAVVLVHGIDHDGNGVYDLGLGPSDLDAQLVEEATAPALCGSLRPGPGGH
jgi:hypothetical protein